jgi:mRNA interferase MazF
MATLAAGAVFRASSPVLERIGRQGNVDVVRLNQAVTVFLGLAASPRMHRKGEG